MFKKQKKQSCCHDWFEVGEVTVDIGFGMGDIETHIVLYCPKCNEERSLTIERAKIELEKARVKREYKGREEADPCY